MVDPIKHRITELVLAIIVVLQTDPLWWRLDGGFRTTKGKASRTVARLMAEIGKRLGKVIAKLAG